MKMPIKYLATNPQEYILSAAPWNSAENADAALPGALAASVIGLAGSPLFFVLRRIKQRRKTLAAAEAGKITPEEAAAKEKHNLRISWIMMSLIFYALLAGSHFTSDTRAQDIKLFGAAPFGLPVTLVVIAIGTVLYLPTLWVQWHGLRLAAQAR